MFRIVTAAAVGLTVTASILASDVVPPEIQQPGTQPGEVTNLQSPDKCDNCHGGYDPAVEPAYIWRGSMMANAGRDPLFWATLAVAEQDFDGAGDLCLRCHSPAGWMAGRSTPTDGSGLAAKDANGVQCDLCHKITNPDDSEWIGVQAWPFIANDGAPTPTGYYGSGMYSLWPGSEKMGPYDDAEARHQFAQSSFHRSVDFCGTCHDVSNPAVGDLAHNQGVPDTADPVVSSGGALGGPVEDKAAFNNFPYQYGIVERTFSEYKAGLLSRTPVSAFLDLPPELQDPNGAPYAVYQAALIAGTGGDYADGVTTRFFSCQSCHMSPTSGAGCDKSGAPIRQDLPLHDMTGGNYWVPDAIQYQEAQGTLRLGEGLSGEQIAALNDGKARARGQLEMAASLRVAGDVVTVFNLTGHKLISGYPEGRRMWLNTQWFDGDHVLLREDGAYGPVDVQIDGQTVSVETILDLHGADTRIYEAHYGMTQEWAHQLVFDYGVSPALALSYDRVTGDVDMTLAGLAALSPGSTHETFHFVLNNTIIKDNRIPPWGMDQEEARKRNALPVPNDQYGPDGGTYRHWDDVPLTPPAGAVHAVIRLLYQPTSWEYIQFLHLANDGTNAFLAAEGANLLDAWLNTGMAAPHVMASATWGSAPPPPVHEVVVDALTIHCTAKQGGSVVFQGECQTFAVRETVGILAHVVDDDGPAHDAEVFVEIHDPDGGLAATRSAESGDDGYAAITWKIPRSAGGGTYSVNVVDVVKEGYEFDAAGSVPGASFDVP
jgi:hypothetical protein